MTQLAWGACMTVDRSRQQSTPGEGLEDGLRVLRQFRLALATVGKEGAGGVGLWSGAFGLRGRVVVREELSVSVSSALHGPSCEGAGFPQWWTASMISFGAVAVAECMSHVGGVRSVSRSARMIFESNQQTHHPERQAPL